MHRPFSYLVPRYRFPNKIEVRDADGAVVATIADLPLMENVPHRFWIYHDRRPIHRFGGRTFNGTLSWVEALDGGDGNATVDYRDAVYTLAAPFEGQAEELIRLPVTLFGC